MSKPLVKGLNAHMRLNFECALHLTIIDCVNRNDVEGKTVKLVEKGLDLRGVERGGIASYAAISVLYGIERATTHFILLSVDQRGFTMTFIN